MGNCAHPPPSPKPGEDSSRPLSERELLGPGLAARGCGALPQVGGKERPRGGARSPGLPAPGPGGLSGLGAWGAPAWAPCTPTAPRHRARLRSPRGSGSSTRGASCAGLVPSFPAFPTVCRLGSRRLLISWKCQQPPGRLLVINHSLQWLTPLPNN